LKLAKESGIGTGFAIGRSIWRGPAERWFSKGLNDQDVTELIRKEFSDVIASWQS